MLQVKLPVVDRNISHKEQNLLQPALVESIKLHVTKNLVTALLLTAVPMKSIK